MKTAKEHIANMKSTLKNMMENGSYPEMTNMLLSIGKSKQNV